MNISIQTIYLISASIGILAMVPQIRKLIVVKQSDGFSLTTWTVWMFCQMISFMYASSIDARAYMYVHATFIVFYATMVFLILKYRKRRGIVETFIYWRHRGNEEKQHSVFTLDGVLSSLKPHKDANS